MNEIGIKDQCFGVEVEMTGITRRQQKRWPSILAHPSITAAPTTTPGV